MPEPAPEERPRSLDEPQATRTWHDLQATATHHPASSSPPAEDLPPLPGYEVLGLLGRGGMGVVYRARQTQLNRQVALKMILAGPHADVDQRARFHGEARAVAQLQHPHIVQIFEIGEAGGHPFLALEYVDGGSLAQLLGGTPQPPRRAAQLVQVLALAMEHAHRHGIVHRDLKPANVLLTAEGLPKVTDFGLAKQLDTDSGQTQTGAIMGTPSYMAPEQAEGRIKDVGPAADVYALGAILYEALTGRPPFRGASKLETLEQVRTREPVAPRDLQPRVPRDLETICLKCLRKDAERRYGTAQDLAADLGRFLAGEPIQARPVGRTERLLRWCRRNPVVAGLLAAVLGSLAGGVLVASFFAVQATQEKEQKDHALQEQTKATEGEKQQTELARNQTELAKNRLTETTHALAVSKVLLAQSEWRDNNAPRAKDLLAEVPRDLRGWEWGYLQRQFEGSQLTLHGHRSEVSSVAFRPDGQHLATASWDGTVKVWDVRTGQELLSFQGHSSMVASVVFSPDGQWLATASGDRTAKVWQAQTGQEFLVLKGHASAVTSVAFSPDGQRLATASDDQTAKVWDARTGQQQLTLKGHAKPVLSVAFSPDGQRLATVSEDSTKKLWDARTGMKLSRFNEQGSIGPRSMAISPDGQRLATGNSDQTAKVWNARTGQALLVLEGHTDTVSSVAFSPDGQWLATGSEDLTARMWDVGTGKELLALKGHTGTVSSVAFSPDGQRLATGSKDHTAKIWDARAGLQPLTLEVQRLQIMSASFSPDGQHLATGHTDKTAKVWDVRTGHEFLTLPGHTESVESVAFSPDGQRLATASNDQTARVWDARTGQVLLTLKGHTGGVSSVAFSPDSQHLATASADETAKVWDAHTGQELLSLPKHSGPVTCVAFSLDGQRLATASMDDPTARVWDAHTGQELLTFKGHTGDVTSISFSPDKQRLATASADRTTRVWDARTGQHLLTLKGHFRKVTSVAFSPDGQRLVSGSDDRSARIWDAHSGQQLLSLQGHIDAVLSVAFSPDGQRLATASQDETLKIWNARAAVRSLTLQGHANLVQCVACSSDGQRFATGSDDRTARIWDARTGQELLSFVGHTNSVLSVAFSPDGQRLATGSADETAKVWDARSGQELLTLDGGAEVLSVIFSPDGQRLATGNRYSSVWLWDARTGEELLNLKGHTRAVRSVAFSPDGQRLAAIDVSGRVLAWDVQNGRLLDDVSGPWTWPHEALRSPDRRFLAQPEGEAVYVHDLQQATDADELAFRQAAARLDLRWHDEQALEYEKAGQWFACAFHLDWVITARPGAELYSRHARACVECSRWAEAQADFAELVKLRPGDPAVWQALALTQMALSRPEAYRQTCAQMVERFCQPPEAVTIGLLFGAAPENLPATAVLIRGSVPVLAALPQSRRLAVRTCIARPDAVAEPAGLLPLVATNDPLRAPILCRAGRWPEALLLLKTRVDGTGLLYRALVQHHLGKDTEAKKDLDQAVRWTTLVPPVGPRQTNYLRMTWDQRLELDLLRQEVEELLREGN